MKSKTKVFNIDRARFPSNIFLTGATGVLGGHLMKELLSETSAKLYCLVRAESPQHAMNRLHGFLRVYDSSGSLNEAFKSRVVAIPGEITQPDFGLGEAVYRDLADRVDAIVHAAAITNLFLSLRRIEPTNVGGTRNIIEFSLNTPKKYLCYVSTFTVMGDKTFDPSFVFRENQLDVGQGFNEMTYQRTKFLAETMVRHASDRGLNWNIVRPGQIFGEASTGAYPYGQANIVGLFYDIFKTVIETGIALYSECPYDVVPVDYVSRGIIALGLNADRCFETYHLTNPDTKTYSQTIDLVRQMGYDIKDVTQDEYRRLLFENLLTSRGAGAGYKSSAVSAFKWWFKREGFDFRQGAKTDATYTQSCLEAFHVKCPRVDLDLIRTYLQAGIRECYFPAPAEGKMPDAGVPEVDAPVETDVELVI